LPNINAIFVQQYLNQGKDGKVIMRETNNVTKFTNVIIVQKFLKQKLNFRNMWIDEFVLPSSIVVRVLRLSGQE